VNSRTNCGLLEKFDTPKQSSTCASFNRAIRCSDTRTPEIG